MTVDQYALTSLANLKTALGISASTDDTLLEDCVDRASDIIEQWLGYKVMARDYTEWLDGHYGESFRLANMPVNTVRSVSYGIRDAIIITSADSTLIGATVACDGTQIRTVTTASDGTDTTTNVALATYKSISAAVAQLDALAAVSASTVKNGRSAQLHIQPGTSFLDKSVALTMAWDESAKYRLDEINGTVWLVLDWSYWSSYPCGGQRILVEYNAGEASIPDDIEAACIAVASEMFLSRKRDPGLQSESLGQYSYTTKIIGDTASLSNRLYDMIGMRRRIR